MNSEVPVHYSSKILLFTNPIRNNLCFSNSIVSLLLNIPKFKHFLLTEIDQMNLYTDKNEIIAELTALARLQNFTRASTHHLRTIVQAKCTESGQASRTFGDKKQHDASEFLISIFEQILEDLSKLNNFDELLFGGLYQETLLCQNNHVKQLPIEKLSEILMIPIKGHSIQECFENFRKDEEIRANCSSCQNMIMVKQKNIVAEPTTLILVLNRFDYELEKNRSIKLRDNIEMTKSIRMATGTSYTISSVINHFGDTPQDGHYNVLVNDVLKDKYLLVDDQYVNENVSVTSDYKSNSYIFVYIKDN